MTSPETDKLLKEILKWQKLQGVKLLRDLIPTVLSDEKKKIVYELTDGKTPRTDIEKIANIAGGTISNWWNSWYSYGILIKEGSRYKKIIPLNDLGIEVSVQTSNKTKVNVTGIKENE